MRSKDLREMSENELKEELRKNREALFKLRFRSTTGKLENPLKLRLVRRDVAKILTILKEREISVKVGT